MIYTVFGLLLLSVADISGNAVRNSVPEHVKSVAESSNTGTLNTRVKRGIYLYNVHKDRIDLVIQPERDGNRRWKATDKISVKYWEENTNVTTAELAQEPVSPRALYRQRIPDGPLRGYRRGVVISHLQPDTTYNVCEVVYEKSGETFVEKPKPDSLRAYRTLPDEIRLDVDDNESPAKLGDNALASELEEGLKPLA